ncbi:MAG: hypothetical protein QM754_20520 [Tepidisphaeraceae bacterium]
MSGLLAYTPLLTPLPLWDYWAWLIIPLCAAVATVYKTIKCRYVTQIPREAAVLTLWIVLAMIGVAAGIWLLFSLMVTWGN